MMVISSVKVNAKSQWSYVYKILKVKKKKQIYKANLLFTDMDKIKILDML